MTEMIAIWIGGAGMLFGLPLWLIFIAEKEQEHINPDISEEDSNRAWAFDAGDGGSVMLGASENSGRSVLQCTACGRETELFELPGGERKILFRV